MMKKLPVLFSGLLIAAMFLAACSGANNNDNNLGTPGVGDTTGTQIVPETGGATPTMAGAATAAVEPTATMAAAEPTATLAATEPAAGQPTATVATGVQATPAAGTATVAPGGAAATSCRPYQLTSYLDYEVVGADGEEIGEVDGLVVYRDAALVPADKAPDFKGFKAGQFANPRIAYFVVDFDDAAGFGDAETLIPFGAFTALTAQTPVEDCRLVFSKSYELDGFPKWDWDARPDFAEENWDNEWFGFWSNLGVDVPKTAASGQKVGNAVVFRDNFDDINVLNLNGEDLGEIEEFIVDPATGEINYAVLAAGGFLGLGEKMIPVPMSQVIWGNYDDDSADLGEIYINHPDDGWDKAPVIDDLDNVDFSVDTWAEKFDAYWESLTVPAP